MKKLNNKIKKQYSNEERDGARKRRLKPLPKEKYRKQQLWNEEE